MLTLNDVLAGHPADQMVADEVTGAGGKRKKKDCCPSDDDFIDAKDLIDVNVGDVNVLSGNTTVTYVDLL